MRLEGLDWHGRLAALREYWTRWLAALAVAGIAAGGARFISPERLARGTSRGREPPR